MTRLQADLLLTLVAVIWGSAFVAQNLGMANVGPFTFTGSRFLIGALVILPLVLREIRTQRADESAEPLDIYDLKRITVLGLLLFGGAALQQIGIMSTSVTNAGFLTALYVPLVPILSWLILRELPHWIVWPAATGCMIGTWFLTGGQSIALNSGDLWVIGSSLFWAAHVLLVGHSSSHRAGPFTVAFGQFVVVGILASLVAFATEAPTLMALQLGAGAIAYAGILSVGFGFTGQVVGQRYTPAADTAIILSMETAFAALFGAWWLGERLDVNGWVGCTMILASILAVQLAPMLQASQRETVRS